MKLKQILVALLLVIAIIPVSTADNVILETVSEESMPSCVEIYDSTNQKMLFHAYLLGLELMLFLL